MNEKEDFLCYLESLVEALLRCKNMEEVWNLSDEIGEDIDYERTLNGFTREGIEETELGEEYNKVCNTCGGSGAIQLLTSPNLDPECCPECFGLGVKK